MVGSQGTIRRRGRLRPFDEAEYAERLARVRSAMAARGLDGMLISSPENICYHAAWQGVIERAGLSGYRRHHCGYAVGIGFPPSWSGGGVPLGLRAGWTRSSSRRAAASA